MPRNLSRNAVLALCIAAVVIAAVVVLLWTKPEPAEPEDHSNGEEPRADALAGAQADNATEPADDVDDELLQEHLSSLVEAPDTPRPAVARILEESKENMREKHATQDARFATIQKYFTEVPLYGQIESGIKEALLAEYGPITAAKVPTLLNNAITLKEAFWGNGDFDHLENFDVICKSRALLELSLEADPSNEAVLTELIDVLLSGWPKTLSMEYDSERLDFAHLQHKYDIRVAIERLWTEHVSKRDAATPQDMAYALDLLVYCWTDAEELRKYESMAKNLGLQPREGFLGVLRKSVTSRQDLTIVEWAIAHAEKMGSEGRFYRRMFCPMIDQIANGQRPIAYNTGHTVMKDTTSYSDYADEIRFSGTGSSFMGPAKRKERLEPYHISWLAAHPD